MTVFFTDMFEGLDTTQKIFTDPQAVALALRIINAFNPTPRPQFLEVKDRLGERSLGLYPFPGIQGWFVPVVISTAKAGDWMTEARKLADNPGVVCILAHESFSKDGVQWMVSIVKDRGVARKLTGEQ